MASPGDISANDLVEQVRQNPALYNGEVEFVNNGASPADADDFSNVDDVLDVLRDNPDFAMPADVRDAVMKDPPVGSAAFAKNPVVTSAAAPVW